MDKVVLVPPRQEMAAAARAKVEKGEPLTPEEQRLLILALPRKVRRTHKVRTTSIRAELDALTMMAVPGTPEDDARKARNKAKAHRKKARAA